MRSRAALFLFAWESVIFLFPLFSEICAFAAALHVKNSNPAHGGSLLMLLAAVKLAASLFEYKGFEEAYVADETGPGSVFTRIGFLQLAQGVVLPGLVLLFAAFAFPWEIEPLFLSLLVWTGVISACRQFLCYHWRVRLRASDRSRWITYGEIVLAYAWVCLLAASTFASKLPHGSTLLAVITLSWKPWVALTLGLVLWLVVRHRMQLVAGLSFARWTASIGHAFTSQLSKEFFIMAATSGIAAGFIARMVVTLYGVLITFPVAFFRIRIFDRHCQSPADIATGDSALRKAGALWGVGCLLLLPFAGQLRVLTHIEFPFAAALLALALVAPLAAFDALAYFSLIRQGGRNRYSLAAATGGLVCTLVGFVAVRTIADDRLLTFLLVVLLGLGDFIINRMSKALANRYHVS